MALTTTAKKQQSTNKWWQRWRTRMAGKRQGVVAEVEERLLCSSGGFIIWS